MVNDYKLALKRIEELEQIILALKDCYQWDRSEYQSNPTLVAIVDKAMKHVRGYDRTKQTVKR